AVDLVATDHGRDTFGVGFVAGRHLCHPRGRSGEVVAVTGLVVDERYRARPGAAKCILVGSVCEPTCGENRDVLGCAVRSSDLVKGPAIRAEEGPNRA